MWVDKQLQLVKDYYLDGINFDYEEAILQSQPELRDGYTSLVAQTTATFKSFDPSLMVRNLAFLLVCSHEEQCGKNSKY